MDLAEKFKEVNDEYIKFERVENKRSQRPNLHAFLLLDELFPNVGRNMVYSSGHDEIWLDVDEEKSCSLTDDQILELTRCGVRYDGGYLCMLA